MLQHLAAGAFVATRRRDDRRCMSRVDNLNRVLRSLQSSSPGRMIASALPQHVDESRVAGMTATLSSLGTRAATELERGEVEEVLVRGHSGYAVMMAAASGTLLLCLASSQAKLGLVFLDMRRAITDIRKIL